MNKQIVIIILTFIISVSTFSQDKVLIYNSNNCDFQDGALFSDFTIDQLNNIWISTWNSGIIRFNGQNWKTFSKANSNLPTNKISSIESDTQNLWINFENESIESQKGGLYFFDIKNIKFSKINSPAFHLITYDNQGRIWISNTNDYRFYKDGQWTKYKIIIDNVDYTSKAKDFYSQRNCLYIINMGGVFKYENKIWNKIYIPNNLCPNCIPNKVDFDDNNMYLATNEGLYKIKGENDWSKLEIGSLEHKNIIDFLILKGEIWVIYLNGIICMDKEGNIVKRFSGERKYFRPLKILPDNFGNIWILYEDKIVEIKV